MTPPRMQTDTVARKLRATIARGQKIALAGGDPRGYPPPCKRQDLSGIQKELSRFEREYPSHTRAHELLRAALATNLSAVRELEAVLATLAQP